MKLLMELIRCAVNSGNETLYGGFNAIGKVLLSFPLSY